MLDLKKKKRPEENGTMMVELSFNLPTMVVWLKQAMLYVTLVLKYFKMTVNVQLSLPKADNPLAVKTRPTRLFNLPHLSPRPSGLFQRGFPCH